MGGERAGGRDGGKKGEGVKKRQGQRVGGRETDRMRERERERERGPGHRLRSERRDIRGKAGYGGMVQRGRFGHRLVIA